MFDCHIHTKNSPDSKQLLDEACESAIKKGLSGISVTDHVDMWFHEKENTRERIANSISEAIAAGEKYKGWLSVFKGVEMAEYMFNPKFGEEILSLTDYDIVLGSVHSVLYEDWTDSYSRLPFGKETTSIEKINGFLREYLSKVLEMAEKTDIDVLSHLTCPLRYINGKFDRRADISLFDKEISDILSVIIERQIALEINTSGINTRLNDFMPSYDIIKKYREMGGELITIASDAHVPENVGNGFKTAKEALLAIGFKHYNYYEKRKAKEVGFNV